MKDCNWAFVLVLLGGVCAAGEGPNQSQSLKTSTATTAKGRNLGPCQTCRILATSFQNGIVRTATEPKPKDKKTPSPINSSDEGNNTTATPPPPPEEPITPTPFSVRFQAVMKGLCAEVKVGREQCLELGQNETSNLEEWFGWTQQDQSTTHPPPLVDHLCMDKLGVCCPWNNFGPSCSPCPDCSGHGKCKGNGTRKGNGQCLCDRGYKGDMCGECDRMHYEAYRDGQKIVCSLCHRSCAGGCMGAGPKSCESCNEGWEVDEDKGCLDMNECLMIEKTCTKDEFCVNTEGSYACFGCDRSCDGCFGDGPDMCEKCAEGFALMDKLCIDQTSSVRDRKVDIARYMTYFGLCVSTCIIFQKNMAIASVIGVAVGVYIATSEYLLNEDNEE